MFQVTVVLASARPQSGNQQDNLQNNQFLPNPTNPFLQNGQNQAGGNQGTVDSGNFDQTSQQMNQIQQPNQNQQQVPASSTTPPTVSETSPRFLRCLSNCPVLSQYK